MGRAADWPRPGRAEGAVARLAPRRSRSTCSSPIWTTVPSGPWRTRLPEGCSSHARPRSCRSPASTSAGSPPGSTPGSGPSSRAISSALPPAFRARGSRSCRAAGRRSRRVRRPDIPRACCSRAPPAGSPGRPSPRRDRFSAAAHLRHGRHIHGCRRGRRRAASYHRRADRRLPDRTPDGRHAHHRGRRGLDRAARCGRHAPGRTRVRRGRSGTGLLWTAAAARRP
jgi:hypothetical protein